MAFVFEDETKMMLAEVFFGQCLTRNTYLVSYMNYFY